MQGAEDKVTGEGRLDGDLRRLMVTNLTHQDNVRRLSHHGAKNALESQADLMAHLSLVDTRQVVLNRVLGGDDLHIRLVEILQRRVERCRLSGSGRPRHQEDAVGALDDLIEALVFRFVEAQLLKVHQALLLVEDTHDDALAMAGGQRTDTKIDRPAVQLDLDTTILRPAFLSHIHTRHDLDTREDRSLQTLGRIFFLNTDTVNTITNPHALLEGLDMNITGPLLESVRDQLGDILDNRRIVGISIFTGVLAAANLYAIISLSNDVAKIPGEPVIVINRFIDVLGCRDRRLNLLVEQEAQVVENHQVHRLHRHDQGPVLASDGNDVVLDRHILGYQRDDLFLDLGRGEIRIGQPPMRSQRAADVLLGAGLGLHESLSNPTAFVLGVLDRLINLSVVDDPFCLEDLADRLLVQG